MIRDDPVAFSVASYVPDGYQHDSAPFRVYDKRMVEDPFRRRMFEGLSGEIVDVGCGRRPFPWAKFLIDSDPFGRAGKAYSSPVPGIVVGSGVPKNGIMSYTLADERVLCEMKLQCFQEYSISKSIS